ncbi:MAG TPA: TlpA disulfide reductase family protein, partial [Gemmataceae bacterium]|nr:TlpA disulfide reductase family protein [Gemmataceae bacterium]
MRRTFLASLVLVCGSLGTVSADEPVSPLGRKLIKLQKQFAEDEQALKKKLADAKDAEEKRQVNFQLKELNGITASDAVELAEEGKREDAGLDAALFAIKLLGQYQITGNDMDKAGDLILRNHVDSPKIAPALVYMVDVGPTGLAFLETVVDKATNAEVKGLALYYNALALDGKASRNEGRASDEAVTRVRMDAAALMEKAVKIAPEAKVGDQTLAKAAAGELISLKIAVGNPVPDIEGTDLEGKKVKLSSYRGKVVLFDFWATWCGPCVAMIPHERDLVEKLKDKPFALLSVNVDDEKSTVTEFLGKDKMPWNHWWDGPKGPVCKMFRIHSYPTL